MREALEGNGSLRSDWSLFRCRALHVAQPSLSVQIRQLEEEIGVALFIRSKRHVEITRPGKVFLKTAREALAMLGSIFLRRRAAELCDSYQAGAE